MRYARVLPVLALATGFAVAAAPAAAQGDKSSHAGYVDIDWSEVAGDKPPTVQVMLERPLLKLIASASKDSDEDIDDLISQLAFVRVNVYEDLPDAGDGKLAEVVDARVSALADEGWSAVVKIREDSDRVDVLMKATDETIVGLVVFVAGEDELVFVNLAGEIDPEAFGSKLGPVVAKVSGGELKIDDMAGVIDSLKQGGGASSDEGAAAATEAGNEPQEDHKATSEDGDDDGDKDDDGDGE